MGDKANLAEDAFESAGQTEAIKQAGIAVAKKNMLELLKHELEDDALATPKEQY